jgi:drug/metabolite transporter (DMT)-like permease
MPDVSRLAIFPIFIRLLSIDTSRTIIKNGFLLSEAVSFRVVNEFTANGSETSMMSGQFLAILSAALFGVSPVLCKLVINEMSPALLAGLLYLGSGIGLQLLLFFQRRNPVRELQRISPESRLKLLGAVVSGGIIAPLALSYGIKYGAASEVTLLLNLETVATTLLAWVIFKEYIGPRVWTGKILILIAASVIVFKTEGVPSLSLSGLLIVLACIFWGVDNNLTRDVVELPSTSLACIKGFGAGLFNIALALLFSPGSVTGMQIGGALAIGAVSFGLSLVLFVEALRRIGSSRTVTFFSIGPFVGMLLSIVILGERPPAPYWLAAALMLAGIFLIYREKHGHLHIHAAVTHLHKHVHDEHHLHPHAVTDDKEPHLHIHTHRPMTHIHGHWPDIHHRHGHK